MTGVEFTDRIMSEEIFGPVLPILRYTDLDAAIAQVMGTHRLLFDTEHQLLRHQHPKLRQHLLVVGPWMNAAAAVLAPGLSATEGDQESDGPADMPTPAQRSAEDPR